MAKENMKYILGAVLAFAVIATVVMASPRGKGVGGFDEYGYNPKSETFNGCWTNYINWKNGADAIECSETDTRLNANWHFDKEGKLEWLINLKYYPVSGIHYLYRMVTIDAEECSAIEGAFMGDITVTQTQENVPICIVTLIRSGDEPIVVATPAGFGLYKNE